jgi:hypothetical protein
MAHKAHRIESACKSCYARKKPCNYFVRDVARTVGIELPAAGDADSLIKAASLSWRPLTAQEAVVAAERGIFVIAGLKSTEMSRPERHGHVAVVLPGKIGRYPRVAATNDGDSQWGKSNGNAPLTHVFAAVDAPRVRYFGRPAGASGSW